MKKILIASLLAIFCVCAAAGICACDLFGGNGLKYNLSDDKTYYTVRGTESSDLTEIEIPETYKNLPVAAIGFSAFYGNKKITSITISNSVTSIGDEAFVGCTSLTSVTLGENVTSIGEKAFGGCSSLTSITLPDSVTSIGCSAFSGCTSLTDVSMSNNIITFNDNVNFYGSDNIFAGCTSLNYYTTENAKYLGNPSNNYLILVKVDSTAMSFTINSNTRIIYYEAFSSCSYLKNVTIPDSVTSIGSHAFDECTSLTSVTIPDSVTSIGSSAFYCCNLSSVTLGKSVTYIGSAAFAWCTSLTKINIPDSVTSISEHAFAGCSSLTSVTFEDTDGWYVTKTLKTTSGTDVDVTDSSQNVTYLTDTYYGYYWYKK